MRPVAERVAKRSGVGRECVEVLHLEGQVGQIRPDDHRTTSIEFANLEEFLAARSLQEDKLRATPAGAAADFLQSKDAGVKEKGLVEIGDPVAGVKEAFNHGIRIGAG